MKHLALILVLLGLISCAIQPPFGEFPAYLLRPEYADDFSARLKSIDEPKMYTLEVKSQQVDIYRFEFTVYTYYIDALDTNISMLIADIQTINAPVDCKDCTISFDCYKTPSRVLYSDSSSEPEIIDSLGYIDANHDVDDGPYNIYRTHARFFIDFELLSHLHHETWYKSQFNCRFSLECSNITIEGNVHLGINHYTDFIE